MSEAEKTAAEQREDWSRLLLRDRPIYECPQCKQKAMQFHATAEDEPGREDFFRCCACGMNWEL